MQISELQKTFFQRETGRVYTKRQLKALYMQINQVE